MDRVWVKPNAGCGGITVENAIGFFPAAYSHMGVVGGCFTGGRAGGVAERASMVEGGGGMVGAGRDFVASVVVFETDGFPRGCRTTARAGDGCDYLGQYPPAGLRDGCCDADAVGLGAGVGAAGMDRFDLIFTLLVALACVGILALWLG